MWLSLVDYFTGIFRKMIRCLIIYRNKKFKENPGLKSRNNNQEIFYA
jgi:hypothetical protein